MSILRELRHNAALTQKQLAARCGVVRQTISNIELGITRPSVDLAKKIAQIFGVDWFTLFDENAILNDKEN